MLWLHSKKDKMEKVIKQAWNMPSKNNMSAIYKRLVIMFEKLNLIERALTSLQKCTKCETQSEDLIHYCYKKIMYLHLRNNDKEKTQLSCKRWIHDYPQTLYRRTFLFEAPLNK